MLLCSRIHSWTSELDRTGNLSQGNNFGLNNCEQNCRIVTRYIKSVYKKNHLFYFFNNFLSYQHFLMKFHEDNLYSKIFFVIFIVFNIFLQNFMPS